MSHLKWNPELLSEHAKNHKKCCASYELIVPKAFETNFGEDVVFGIETPAFVTCFTKHKFSKKIEQVYDSLKTNYERECGDLIKYSDPDTVFFVIATEIAPGLKPTRNFRYVGILEVHDDIIQFVWLHPYLRNKNIMTRFFEYYAKFENMLCVQPPVSDQFSAMMKKAQDKILSEADGLKIQLNFTRKYFKKRVPESEIDDLSDEEIMWVRQALEIYCATSPERSNDNQWKDIVIKLCQCAKFFRENPDAKKQMTKWAEQNVDVNQFKEMMSSFKKYG